MGQMLDTAALLDAAGDASLLRLGPAQIVPGDRILENFADGPGITGRTTLVTRKMLGETSYYGFPKAVYYLAGEDQAGRTVRLAASPWSRYMVSRG